MEPTDNDDGAPLRQRGPELATAGFLLLMAVLVIVDSLRVGIGWADDGPRAGYFPFYIGLLLGAASLGIIAVELLRKKTPSPVFAEREQLKQVVAVAVPTAVYVALIAFIGIYLASALLIGFFMRRHGHYGWAPTLATAIGVPAVFFGVFEKWFLVPLPKGPIEQLLGL